VKDFWEIEFWGNGSKKGSSRKHTGNWVTSWRKLFGGILKGLRCFAKRIGLGEFEVGFFLCFRRGSTWTL
jgi:hypothetical protein